MPDTTTTPTTSPSTAPAGDATVAGDDPFLRLHKMSTTAGIGSQDYVAINALSVVAIILGLASSLALLDPLLLVIPAAGIVCAIVALRQIGRSNQTQTGKALAWGGMLLSLLFCGLVGGRELRDAASNRADEQSIARLIEQLDTDIKRGDWEHLYAQCSDRFTERVSPEQFIERWNAQLKNPYFGKINRVSWKGVAAFYTEPQTQQRVAQSQAIFDVASGEQRIDIGFRRVDDKWMIDALPQIFPQEQPGQGGPAGGGQMGPPRPR